MKKLLSCLIFLSFLLLPSFGICEEARIDDVTVAKAPLKVSFLVRGAFTKDIEEAIKSGIPTSFNFIIELNKVNSLWPNEQLGKWEFKHTVKYDSLKEEYEILFGEANEKGIRTKDFGEMKRLMTTASSVAVAPYSPVRMGEEYEFRIKAELHTVEMPLLLDYVLFFMKFWDFETGWYSYRFIP